MAKIDWIRRLLLCIFLLGCQFVFAQTSTVVEEGAPLYQNPNFDSGPIQQLHMGDFIEVSKRTFGEYGFHRVRTAEGKMGYMIESDFKLGKLNLKAPAPISNAGKAVSKQKSEVRHLKPFRDTKFYGISFDQLWFRENTFGLTPTSAMPLLGLKLVGPNLWFEGDTVTEFNFQISPQAPGYYQQATGNSASGFLLHADYLLNATFVQSPRFLTFLGFGPMLRYSNFQVALNSGTNKSNAYTLTDAVFGAVINAGIGMRFSSSAARLEYRLIRDNLFQNEVQLSWLFPF